jgi:peptide/nickel transport system substrate-binding protein
VRMHQRSALLALPLTIALAVTACGGSSSSTNGTKTNVPASNLPTLDINAHPVSDLKDGGTLKWAIEQFGPQWNYLEINGTDSGVYNTIQSMMPGPTITDQHANVSFNPAYWTSAKVISTSPQKVEYKLNPKAKWSNGRAMNIEDYVAQWKALNGTNTKFAVASTTGYEQISDVSQGTDQYDVILTFKTPFAEWPTLFNPLYPKEVNADPKTFSAMYNEAIPITGGPFKFGSFDKSAQTVTVVRDPNWWGNKPKLQSIVYKTLSGTAADQAFANGEIDYDYFIANVASAYGLAKSSKSGHVTVAGGPNQRHFTFHSSGVLADLNVRKAIAMGTNRLAFARSDLNGLPIKTFATLDNHIFVPGQVGYQNNAGEVGTYAPDKAKAALDAAGWKMGSNGYRNKAGKELDVRFTIPAGTASSANEAKLYLPMMQAIGVKLVITTVPSNDFFTKYINTGNFDITPFTWIGTPFPGSGAKAIYINPKAGGGQNYTGLDDPVIDQDFKDALGSIDPAVYRSKLNDADKHVWDEVHSLMLFQRLDMDGVSNNVANLGSFGFSSIDYTKIGFLK